MVSEAGGQGSVGSLLASTTPVRASTTMLVAQAWSGIADANTHKGSAYDRAPPSTTWTRLYRDVDRAPLRWLVAGAHGQAVSQLPDRRAVFDVYVTPNGYILDKRSL